jgi:hypothetical protein
MQLPLPSGSHKHPSRPTNYQLCINYFPTSSGENGRGKITLLPTMGSRLISDPEEEGPIRFVKKINDIIYFVVGNKFISADIDQYSLNVSLTTIGTLNSSSGTVIGTNNPTQIILLDGTDGYIYNFIFAGTVPLGPIGGSSGNTYTLTINGVSIYSSFSVSTSLNPLTLVSTINTHSSTTKVQASYQGGLLTLTALDGITSIVVTESGTGFVSGVNGISVNPGVFSSSLPFEQFQQITDTDFVGGSHVVYIDGYFIVNNSDTQKFQFSQPNEGRIWNGLDVAAAESKPDLLVAMAESKSELWLFGSNSIEVWYDNGNPVGPPFTKRVGSDINIGCLAPYSVTNVSDLLVWVDSRGFIVQSDVSNLFRDQSTGYTLKKISTEELDAELATYPLLNDAIGMTYVDRGHVMYEVTFPAAKKTWVRDFTTETWHERNHTNSELGTLEHSLNQYCDTYNGLIISGGIRDNKIYLLSSTIYDDNGDLITRIFTTPHYEDPDFKLIGVNDIELKVKTGSTSLTGYSSMANVMMQFSNDGGYTWSNEELRPIGSTGEYMKRLIWNIRGTSYQWILLFKITAPIDHAIIDLRADIIVERT